MLRHLPVKKLPPFVLLPGDPARVDLIGKKLKNFKILGQKREFRLGIGTYKNIPVAVFSTGIGCPSTAIATEEAIEAGAKVLIRIGTCGGAWRSDIKAGSLIIPTSSVRDEGTTREYIPEGFPAISDPDVFSALKQAAQESKYIFATGINRTHDAFYGDLNAIIKWGSYLKQERWKGVDTPIISSEMESSALFVIASLQGVKAGAIFAVNANPEPLRARLEGKKQQVVSESDALLGQKTVERATEVALSAIEKLAAHHQPSS